MRTLFVSLIVFLSIICVFFIIQGFLLFSSYNSLKNYESLYSIENEFNTGDSFSKILYEEGLGKQERFKMAQRLGVLTKNIYPGQKYDIIRDDNGGLFAFIFYPRQRESYKIMPQSLELYYNEEPLKKMVGHIKGEINSSLYLAIGEKASSALPLAISMSEIFAWQIDFFTDPRKGDEFNIVFEEYKSEDFYKLGKILAVVYRLGKKVYEAFYFEGGYYDRAGKSLKKAFLKAPLNYKRISSYFSLNRMHPILKYRRPHLGIDYAAPRGTPVVSIADGRVIYIGRNGGFGRMIKIKHKKGYESWYAHLYRYAKKLRKGLVVKQGDVIGYVGSTGLSTGPHLDFRVKRNGRFINYLDLSFPSASSILPKDMGDFTKTVETYSNYLQ